MADFGAIQPRQFIMDSSRQNGATLGEFHQNNNRYVCTLELFDHSVPVSIPAGANISIKCKKNGTNNVYVLDANNPDFASKVSFVPGENKIKVDRWGAMVAQDGQILLGVEIDGMSTYTVVYTVDKDQMGGKRVMHHETPIDSFANKDLSNVEQSDLLAMAKKAGLAENDLEDVDLAKLSEKVEASDIGKVIKGNEKSLADLRDPSSFDKLLKANAAFKAVSERSHDSTKGMTPDQVRGLFFSNRFEEQGAVDFSQSPYKDSPVIFMAYQFTSNNQTIEQKLPAVSSNKIIMVELINSSGISGGKVKFTLDGSDSVSGLQQPYEVAKEGMIGFFFPIKNEGSYDFIMLNGTQDVGMSVSDERGNMVINPKELKFKEPFFVEDNDGVPEVNIDASASSASFVDGDTGKDFVPTKVQSLDGSLRIANLGGVADLSVKYDAYHEGVMATLGNDQLFNSAFDKTKFLFSDVKHKGGSYVYQNEATKSFVIQEIDNKDPNKTDGTEFLVGFDFKPKNTSGGVLTQDGYIRIEFADQNGDVIDDIYGNPMATEIHYKAGQIPKEELYLGFVRAKSYTEIHPRIETSFASEEIIGVSADTAIVVQAITKDASSGLALLNFMAYTGHKISISHKVFSYNSMNVASYLTQDEPASIAGPQTSYWGDGVWFDSRGGVSVGISNYQLIVRDTGGQNLPVFSLFKVYDKLDAFLIKNSKSSAMAKVKIADKKNSFKLLLLKYTGLDDVPPMPNVLRYENTQPVFEAGWEIVDTMFISEDVVDGVHEERKEFTFPNEDSAETFAFVFAPTNSESPMEMKLEDIEVDFVPSFSRSIVVSNSNIDEEFLFYNKGFFKAETKCPSGTVSYRYTVGNADTKIPAGVVKGANDAIVNNNAWSDAGSEDPNKVQGDLEFKFDGKVNFEYGAQIYNETGTVNNVEFWIAKVNGDGTFTEVPNSRYATTIEANRTKLAKKLVSNSFDFEVKENESYRIFAKSDKADGFYLECGQNGSPLFYSSIVFEEIKPIDKRIIDMINAKK